MIKWIATRWATAAVSNWLVIVGITAVASLMLYIQQLRVDAARCKGQQDVAAQLESLRSQLIERTRQDRKEALDELSQIPSDDCLNRRSPLNDILRD